MKTLFLRNREIKLTPFDLRFAQGQKREHNVLSNDGHEWQIAKHGQVRTCTKCFRQECSPPKWVPVPNSQFSTEDISALIALNEVKGLDKI